MILPGRVANNTPRGASLSRKRAWGTFLRVFYFEPENRDYRKSFLDGLRQHSRHEIVSFTLPEGRTPHARRSALLPFLEQLSREQDISRSATQPEDFPAADRVDALITTDAHSLCDLYALGRQWLSALPSAIFFHEHSFAVGPTRRQSDLQAGLNLLYSMLAADRLFFSSPHHQHVCFDYLPSVVQSIPEFPGKGRILPSLSGKARVLRPGIALREMDRWRHDLKYASPTVLWNQRWEASKRPDEFFRILYQLADEGLDFGVVICGNRNKATPDGERSVTDPVFDEARRRLGDRVFHYGYAGSRAEYANLLWMSDIVVSTAEVDYYPTAIIEAIFCECFPLLPNRLGYPSLFPAGQHERFLYDTPQALYQKLKCLLLDPLEIRSANLRANMLAFDWEKVIADYDRELVELKPAFRTDILSQTPPPAL